jgi:hypothetical protein
MGMFKDLRTLRQQAREISEDYDVKTRLDSGMTRMRAAQEMFTEQTKAATMAASAETGVPATAVIAAVSQTGMMMNFQPALRIDLTVMPDGRPPYPATVNAVVQQIFLAKAVPGRSVPVKVDPEDPGSIWIDWARA